MSDFDAARRRSGAVLALLLSVGLFPAHIGAVDSSPSPAGADPWWRSAVFYEIFVRSFADSSSGPLAGDGIGDLAGLIEHLDYLNDGDPATDDDLEIGALWLMPIMQSPSYHGYDVTDYRTIEKDYGTNADFKRLIDEAHARGIRVIVDLVLNHTSSRHPWFRDAWRQRSPYHDFYIWSHETRDYRGPWGQPVWHELRWWQRGWKHFNYLAYYGIFWSGMPDLNYENPNVTRAMFDVARFWLEEMGADGFRLDAVRHLIEDGAAQDDTPATHQWLRGFQRFVHEVEPDAVTVGEVWDETEIVAGYGPDELDLAFEFELAAAILDAVREGSAARLATTADESWNAFGGVRFATFLTNHDQPRVFSELDGDVDEAKLAAALLLTLPGVPFLYYGEEIGMEGLKPDPLIRRPMQWSAGEHAGFSSRRPWQEPHPNFRNMTVAAQADDPDSLLSHYRRLIRLRNRHASLHSGDFALVSTGNDAVFAFRRRIASETALVVANLGDEPVARYALGPGAREGAAGAPVELLGGHPAAAPPRGDGEYRPVPELAPKAAYVFVWAEPPPGQED